MTQHPKKRTIGVRIPKHRTTLALLDALGSPLVSSTLLLPDHPEPLADGWTIKSCLITRWMPSWTPVTAA